MNKENNLNQDKKLDLTKNYKSKNKIPSLEDFTVSLQAILDSEDNVSECASKLFSKIFSGELSSIEDIQKKLSLLSNILLLYSNRDYSLASLIDSITFPEEKYIPNPHLDTFEECSEEDFFSSMKFKTPKNSSFKVTTTKITTNPTKDFDNLNNNTVTIDEFNKSRVNSKKINKFNEIHNNIQTSEQQEIADINNTQDINNIDDSNLTDTRDLSNNPSKSKVKINPHDLLQNDSEQVNKLNSLDSTKQFIASRNFNINATNNEQIDQNTIPDNTSNLNKQVTTSQSINNQINQFDSLNNINQPIDQTNNLVNNNQFNTDTRYQDNNLFTDSRNFNSQTNELNSPNNRNQIVNQSNSNQYNTDARYQDNVLFTNSRNFNNQINQFNSPNNNNQQIEQINNQYTDTRYQPFEPFNNSRNRQSAPINSSRNSNTQADQFNTAKYSELNNFSSNMSNTDEINTCTINVPGLEGLNPPFCCSNTAGVPDSASILNAAYIKNGVYFLKKIRLYIRATKSCIFYELYYSTRTQKLLFTIASNPYNYSHTYII